MGTKTTFKKITLNANTISVNGIDKGTTYTISNNEVVDYYHIVGNATLTGSLSIGVAAGLLTDNLVVKFFYDATMVLSGNTITILGFSIPVSRAAQSMYIMAKYDAVAPGWDIYVLPSFTMTNIVAENQILTEIAKASKVLTRDVTGAIESAIDIPTGGFGGVTEAQTLTNKSLQDDTTYIIDNADPTKRIRFEVSGVLAGATRVITVLDANMTLVGETNVQTVTNKTLEDDTTTFHDNADATKRMRFEVSGITAATTRVITVLDADMTLVGETNAQTVTNKTLQDNTTTFHDNADPTKLMRFDVSGVAPGATRIITVLDADMTLVGETNAQTLTNKTIDAAANAITNIGITETANAVKTHQMVVTVSLAAAHSVKIKMPACNMPTVPNAVTSCLTIAAFGGYPSIVLKTHVGVVMLTEDLTHTEAGGIGELVERTFQAAMSFSMEEYLEIDINNNGAIAGMAVIRIPYILT